MYRPNTCSDCNARLFCNCCGMFGHEAFCELLNTVCEDCVEDTLNNIPEEPIVNSFVKELSDEELDEIAAANYIPEIDDVPLPVQLSLFDVE